MNFDFGEQEKAFCRKIKELFDWECRTALAKLTEGEIPEICERVRGWLGKLGKAGYLSIGMENSKNSVNLAAVQECLASFSPSLFLSVEVSARVFGRFLSDYGTTQQKSELLPPLEAGGIIGAVGLSEGGMSIENHAMNTAGVPTEEGVLVLGSKNHVVNAPIADWLAVVGSVNHRAAVFLVQRGAKGLVIGERLTTLGYQDMLISPILLENCQVPSKFVVGPFEEDAPIKALRRWEDQILTVAALGQMQRSFDTALKYAKTHHSGGKPIIAYQEIGFKLSEMLTVFQTAQLLAYRAAWMAENEDGEAHILSHCAKVFCTESAEEVASKAIQVLGIHGFVGGNPAEESYRDAKYLQVAGTSTEISRMKIGDGVLERI